MYEHVGLGAHDKRGPTHRPHGDAEIDQNISAAEGAFARTAKLMA